MWKKGESGFKGRKASEKTKLKLREFQLKNPSSSQFKKNHKPFIVTKEKNGRWRGGLSFLPYSHEWTNTLKRAIRERDNYCCKICSTQQGKISLDVHHIDYNKLNCNPDNLVTLCKKCHSRTNSNRQKWTNFFQSFI